MIIDNGATVEGCVVVNGTRVRAGLHLEDAVVMPAGLASRVPPSPVARVADGLLVVPLAD